MTLSQQKFREMVFQLLYSQDIGQADETLMMQLMMNELAISKKNVRLALERVQKIKDRLPEIDAHITSVSTSYEFDRIHTVTKNILRLGVFELFFDDQIPPKVAISEAIRLSRKFNTPESASFVNALLDHLYKASLGDQGNVQNIVEKSHALRQSEEIASEMTQELKREETDSQGENENGRSDRRKSPI